MGDDESKPEQSTDMRPRAEEILRREGEAEPLQELSTQDIQSIVHELRVHQIELEMQNEELRRAQGELVESRNRYSDLYDFAPIGYFTFDTNGTIIEVNLTGARKLGVERRSLIRVPLSLYVAQGSKNTFYQHLLQVFRTGSRQTCELKLVDKSRNQFDARLESMAVQDNTGKPIQCRTAVIDITDRKRVEEALLKAKEQTELDKKRLETILETIPSAMVILEETGKLSYANKRAMQLYGFDTVGLDLDTHLKKISVRTINGEPYPFDQVPVARSLRGEVVRNEELIIQRADGALLPILTSSAPVYDADGKVISAIAVFEDIFERKRAEEELKRAKELSDTLNRINSAINSTLDFDEIMQKVVVEAGKAIGSDACNITLHKEDHWVIGYAYGLSQDVIGVSFTGEQAAVPEFVAQSKRPLVIKNIYTDARSSRWIMKKYGVYSVLAVPLIVKGDVIGILYFDYFSVKPAFSKIEIDFTEKLASSVSLALENARLYSSVQQELSRIRLLQDVAFAATTSPDLHVIASEILKALNKHLQAKAGDIKVLDENNRILRLLSSFGYPEATVKLIQELPVEKSGFLTTEAIRRKKMLTHKDEVLTPGRLEVLKEAGLENTRYMVIPIDYRGKINGAYSLVFEGRRDFTQDEIELFHSIAHTIGQTIAYSIQCIAQWSL